MKKKVFIAVLFIICLAGFSQNREKDIEFVLNDKAFCDSNLNKVIIADSTICIDISEHQLKELLDTVLVTDMFSILEEFNKKNSIKTKLYCERIKVLKCNIICETLDFSKNFHWNGLYDSIPGFSMYIQISNPVYFKQKDNLYMIVYIQHNSGNLSGSAYYYLYILGSEYKLLNSILVWVS